MRLPKSRPHLNIEDVADWLKGTPFEEMLQDSMKN